MSHRPPIDDRADRRQKEILHRRYEDGGKEKTAMKLLQALLATVSLLTLSCGSVFGPKDDGPPYMTFQGRVTWKGIPQEKALVTVEVQELIWMFRGGIGGWESESRIPKEVGRGVTNKNGYYRIEVPVHFERPYCWAGSCDRRWEDSVQAQGPMGIWVTADIGWDDWTEKYGYNVSSTPIVNVSYDLGNPAVKNPWGARVEPDDKSIEPPTFTTDFDFK